MGIKDNYYPEFSADLVDRLLKDFPNKLPDKQISDYELGFLIGQQSIIKKLKAEQDKFNETTPFHTE